MVPGGLTLYTRPQGRTGVSGVEIPEILCYPVSPWAIES